MKNNFLKLVFIFLFLACETTSIFDTKVVNKAIENGDLAHESFKRSLDFTRAWLRKTDSQTGLIPSSLINSKIDLWDPANAAADNYPYMVLTAYLLDQKLFDGPLLDILHQEKKLTSRLNVLPDVYSFSKRDFDEYPPNIGHIIFGASEYIKDGLIPLNEMIGESPWQERMMEMIDELHFYMEDFDNMAKYFKKASNVEEINGEMLQTLSRVYWMTGEEKYLNWAIKIADKYFIDMDLSQIDYLKLRDHGCEIIGGLSEIYLTLHYISHPKKLNYQTSLYRFLDRILVYGRNPDGLFYNAVNLKTGQLIDSRIADTWGYILNAYYTVWIVDQKDEYKKAVLKPFKALDLKYRNYNWEPKAKETSNHKLNLLGSHDGYADSIESGINLFNRLNNSYLQSWIDSQINVMFGMQKPDGIIEGWHGDGNFARTALMYGLWKTQGARLSPWRENLYLGAEPNGDEIYFVLKTKEAWEGKLIFDQMRHKTILNLPVDYPRINQFPEWFTLNPNLKYRIISSDKNLSGIYSGEKLLNGLTLKLSAGAILKIAITY